MAQTDNIRALAEKGKRCREKLALEAAREALETPSTPAIASGEPGEIASMALGGGWRTVLIVGSAALLLHGLALGPCLWLLHAGYSIGYVVGIVLLLLAWLLIWLLSLVVHARQAQRELRRLRAIPFLRDSLRTYVDLLDVISDTKRVGLDVRFVSTPDDELRRTCLDLVLAICADTTAHWESDTLIVSSPEIRTHFTSSKGVSRDDNRGVHRWFRRLLERLLIPLDASNPVASVWVRRVR